MSLLNQPQQKQLTEREIEKLTDQFFLSFLLEKWLITSGEHKGEKYSIRDRPYMLGIIKDHFPFTVILKSAQSGISEEEVARTIWMAKKEKGNLLYTFPAGEQMQQFVDARVREAVVTNPYLAKYVTGTLNLKKFGFNHNEIYFRGVQKRRQVISVDVSKLIADEVDEYEEGTLYTLNKRLGASKNPIRRYFSTPSFHGIGVSLYYFGNSSQRERGSDQRVWTIKCERCGQWNEDLIWEENVVDRNLRDIKSSYYEPDAVVICRLCHQPLNRLSSLAEWVAKFKENSDYCHGFSVSKLFSPTANLNEMMNDSRDPLKEQEFYNSDLGRPYEPKGARITDEVLNNARGVHTIWIQNRDKVRTFGGFDIGSKIHATTCTVDENNKIKLVNASELDSWDDMPNYYNDFHLRACVIDANPDKEEAIQFQKGHDNVWLAYFSQHLENTPQRFTLDWDDQIIHLHRTLLMQVVSDLVHNKDLILPMDISRIRSFYEHMKAPIKAQKQDTKGNWITFYPKTRLPDHYFFSVMYMVSATALKSAPAKIKVARLIGAR